MGLFTLKKNAAGDYVGTHYSSRGGSGLRVGGIGIEEGDGFCEDDCNYGPHLEKGRSVSGPDLEIPKPPVKAIPKPRKPRKGDEKPVDENPVDEKPVDEKPVDEKPVDEKPPERPIG